jgi:hypothetical protein
MSDRDPEFIARWLEQSSHKMDNPAQFMGSEPGAARKPWDSVDVRWLVAASWPYYHSTGNQSIPAVCALRPQGIFVCWSVLVSPPSELSRNTSSVTSTLWVLPSPTPCCG